MFDDAEPVPEVQPSGNLVGVGYFQHDRDGCLVDTSLHFSHERVADATVGFGCDVGEHPHPRRGAVSAACSDLAFADTVPSH